MKTTLIIAIFYVEDDFDLNFYNWGIQSEDDFQRKDDIQNWGI